MNVLNSQPSQFAEEVPLKDRVIPLKDRLRAMLETVLEDARLDPTLKIIIPKLANNFLKNTSDEDIIEAVTKLRDEIIPFLLDNENPNQ